MKFTHIPIILPILLTQGILALPQPQSTDDPLAVQDPTVQVGRNPPKQCGGHTPQPNLCNSHEICAPTQPPRTADFPGTCVFQPCGGKPSNGICPLGLVCVYSPSEKRTDQPGRCLSTKLICGAGTGSVSGSGGTGAGTGKCPSGSGWTCLKNPRVDFEYIFSGEFKEGSGICIPPEF